MMHVCYTFFRLPTIHIVNEGGWRRSNAEWEIDSIHPLTSLKQGTHQILSSFPSIQQDESPRSALKKGCVSDND